MKLNEGFWYVVLDKDNNVYSPAWQDDIEAAADHINEQSLDESYRIIKFKLNNEVLDMIIGVSLD